MKGFTLVELLIVITVMAVLGFIFTNTLVQTLRGQNKSRIISQVKQNGQVTLDKLSNEIRQAEKIICVDSATNTIVIFKGGTYTRFRFYSPVSTGTKSNGYIAWDHPVEEDSPCTSAQILLLPPTSTPTPTPPSDGRGSRGPVLDTPTPSAPLSIASFLTDTDTVNGVSLDTVGAPVFSVGSQAGYKDMVTIKFRVFQGVNAGAVYESAVGPDGIIFTTTVQVRGGK